MKMRLVPAEPIEDMAVSAHAETPYCYADMENVRAIIGSRTCYQAMTDALREGISSAPNGGLVTREMLKAGLRALYGAPENYEPSFQEMEGAVKFVIDLGLEVEGGS